MEHTFIVKTAAPISPNLLTKVWSPFGNVVEMAAKNRVGFRAAINESKNLKPQTEQGLQFAQQELKRHNESGANTLKVLENRFAQSRKTGLLERAVSGRFGTMERRTNRMQRLSNQRDQAINQHQQKLQRLQDKVRGAEENVKNINQNVANIRQGARNKYMGQAGNLRARQFGNYAVRAGIVGGSAIAIPKVVGAASNAFVPQQSQNQYQSY